MLQRPKAPLQTSTGVEVLSSAAVAVQQCLAETRAATQRRSACQCGPAWHLPRPPHVLKPVLLCEQVQFAGIDCSGAALDMAKTALLGSCEGLAARNITLVCKEYTQGGYIN